MAVLEETGRVSFGRFEADLQSGELWKGSIRIHLPAQPFKVLSALLERAGQVVSKEDLQDKVWGKDTNVDFERAIAGAINKIRDALGDSAESPRYIETLPKRGYRFVAPVTVLAPIAHSRQTVVDASDSPATSDGNSSIGPDATQAAAAPVLRAPATARQERTRPVFLRQLWRNREIALCVSVAGLLLALLYVLTQQHPQPILQVDQVTHGGPISEGPPGPENLPSLATDGASIFATARVDGKSQLAAISIGTGNLRRVPVPEELASASIADISRDGSRLLVLSRLYSAAEQPLWVVPTSGGSAFRLGSIEAHAATWMPDGASILYASGNDLFVAEMADGSSVHLMSLPGRAFWLRWSPDGRLLRFTMTDPTTHTSSLWEVERGSNSPHPVAGLKNYHSLICCGVWTADGKNFVFRMYRERASDLWNLSRAFGQSRLTRITQGPNHYFSPIAARSGQRIYFLGSDEPIELQRFDQTQRAFLSAQSFLWDATRVEYSPDGAFIVWTDSGGGLWRARAADGADRLQLAPPYYEVFSAHWSPDGRKLAVMARQPGRPWSIYLENATGGELTPLLNEKHNAADPTWSPDGKQLVFGREPDLMGKESGPREIYLLNLQSRKIEVIPGSDGLFSPRWSPDGKWIAALSLDQKRVMLFDVSSRTWSLLAETSAADPVWSRDSRALYVHAFLADEQPILRLSIPTGDRQVVAALSDFRLKEVENYFFSGVTPNNEPLILPRVGTSNLYTLDLEP